MAKTYGQMLDDVQAAISAVHSSQSYELDGRKLTRADLSTLYKEQSDLISKIENYGRDYIPGQNTKPTRRSVNVQFS